MNGPFATRLFRITFALAGCYNLAFGIWAGFWPQHFFELFEIAPARYPAIWACVGMIVGVYGLLYWYAAWKPDRARPVIAIGLLGKVLGPLGMLMTFGEDWPRRLGMINVYNDLIWLFPFGLFLLRGTRFARWLTASAPWCCALTHFLALIAMATVLKEGTLAQQDLLLRAHYITEHAAAWTVGWALWMLSAVSLVGFYAWWGCQLNHSKVALSAVLIAAFGSVCDLSGESLSVFVLVEHAVFVTDPAAYVASQQVDFDQVERVATLLTAVAANSLYTMGGLLLMLYTPGLPSWIRGLMWITWQAGIGMTVAGLVHHVGAMMVTTALLFPALIAWIVWMGLGWRGPRSALA